MKALRDGFSKYGIAIVFTLFTLITSFYPHLPLEVAYAVLKLPYVILILLGIAVLRKMVKGGYRLTGFAKLLFAGAIALTVVYAFVSAWRFAASGFAAARESLYLAMAAIVGMVMFFAADSGVFASEHKALNVAIIASELNALQLILGAITFGGIRASSLLENIMVFNCIMIALIPQLFQIICREQKGKLRLVAALNLLLGMTIVLISGSRSAVLVMIPVTLASAIACCVARRSAWKACVAILAATLLCTALLFASDLYDARTSIQRVAGWSASQGEAIVAKKPGNKAASSKKKGSKKLVQASEETLRLIEASDNMRSSLWKASMEEIKKSPLIGTGVVSFDCQFDSVVLREGSHNIVLETWLVFGGIGALIYAVVMCGLFLSLLFGLRRRGGAIWTLLSLGAILVLAMVQPLMSMICVTSFFWLLSGCGHGGSASAPAVENP